MMRRKQEGGEGDYDPQPMVEDSNQVRPDTSASSDKDCLASTNPPAAIAQRQPAVTATPTPAQISASKEPEPGQPLSVDIPSKDSLPEHHIQVRASCAHTLNVPGLAFGQDFGSSGQMWQFLAHFLHSPHPISSWLICGLSTVCAAWICTWLMGSHGSQKPSS